MSSNSSLRPLALALALLSGPSTLLANPLNPNVVHGSASFATSGNSLTITNSANAIIEWQGFSVGTGETTRFVQPSSGSAVLNRVTGQDPSQILGNLLSNGRVFLINPNGIIFGEGARIDVNGLVASSLNLSNEDFLNGRYRFSGDGSEGAVRNAGDIRTATGGQVLLIAPDVENTGLITSPQGEIILAAGHSVELADTSNPELRVQVTAPDNRALNLGQLIAEGGNIGMYAGLTENSGLISASSAVAEGGRIYLKAKDTANLSASSRIEANGASGGGDIRVMADKKVIAKGEIQAQGGAGFVETSALEVDFAEVRVTAPGGEWLVDPTDINIDEDLAVTIGYSLDSGTNFTLQTVASGTENGDIFLNADITKNAGGDATLTLQAHGNIELNADVTSQSGKLNLTLIADSDTSGEGVVVLRQGETSTLSLNGGLLDITQGAGILSLETGDGAGHLTLAAGTYSKINNIHFRGGAITNNGTLDILKQAYVYDDTSWQPEGGSESSSYLDGSGTINLYGPIRYESTNNFFQYNPTGTTNIYTSQDWGGSIGGSVANYGSLTLDNSTTFTGAVTNHGTFSVEAPVSINGGLTQYGGTLSGSNTLTGNVDILGGTVAPGSSPGTLTITGNYSMGPNATLLMELGGTSTGLYDQLAITGTASLGGTLQLVSYGGFVPALGASFPSLISATSISGQFTNVFSADSSIYLLAYGTSSVGLTYAGSSLSGPVGEQLLVNSGALEEGIVDVWTPPALIPIIESFQGSDDPRQQLFQQLIRISQFTAFGEEGEDDTRLICN